MAEHRLTRKDMKEPDQFLSTSIQCMHWIGEHTKHLIYGSAGLILLIGLFLVWSSWQKNREYQASILLYEAEKLLNADGGSAQVTDRAQAREHLEKIVSHYGNTAVSSTAYWHLGQLALESGDYTKALQAYKQAQEKSSQAPNAPMFATIMLDTGYAQEASGMCDQAVNSFNAVLQSSAHWLRGEAYMGLGRCYRAMGSQDQAAALVQRIRSDTNLSESARQGLSEHLTSLQ